MARKPRTTGEMSTADIARHEQRGADAELFGEPTVKDIPLEETSEELRADILELYDSIGKNRDAIKKLDPKKDFKTIQKLQDENTALGIKIGRMKGKISKSK